MGEIEGHNCPRCQKSTGYLYFTNAGIEWFCAQKECLEDDVKHSKSNNLNKNTHRPFTDCASEKFQIGRRYKNACLTSWMADEKYKELVASWLKSPSNMILLSGAPGKGKTYFCVAIANFLLEQGKDVYYFNCRKFFERLQSRIQQGKNQYTEIGKVAEVDFLIFDDVGASTNSEWQKEVLLELIDRRYNNMKPTVVTTNLSSEDLSSILGPRIQRRLMSEDNLVICAG